MDILERKACVSGIGQSEFGRPLDRNGLDLTVEACQNAIDDAGLKREDIDGLATWPGGDLADVKDAMRLNLNWHFGGGESPAQLGSTFIAVAAVATGLAKHVLVWRTVTEASGRSYGQRDPSAAQKLPRVSGIYAEHQMPYWAMSAANWIGWFANRHMHEYGVTKEQLAWIALNGRRNAELNPKAIYRDPLTMDDYMNARMISTPFGLYDCDVPMDGSTAVVISRADSAPDLRQKPVSIESIGSRLSGRYSWTQREDLTTMACHDAAEMMWERTDLKPSDIDVACIYDGFSYITMLWLEALGICGTGESGAYVEGGARIARDGEFPLNPHGGQLSAGRMHGYGFLHEACVQLRNEGSERQVQGNPQVAVVATGGGPLGGTMLLTRD